MADEKITIVELDIDQDKALEDLTDLRISIEETNEETKDLIKTNKELEVTNEELAKKYQKNAKQIDLNKVQVKGLSKEYSTQQKVVNDVLQTAQRELGTLEKLTLQNKELRQELRELNLETDEGQKRRVEINDAIDKNTDFIKENSDSFVQSKINVGNYQDAIENSIPAIRNASNGFKNLLKSAKAFIASPIGIIILALAAAVKVLSAAFQRSQKLMDAVKVKTAQLRAGVDVLTDRVSNGLENAWRRLRGEHDKVTKSSKSLREELREEAAAARELAEAENLLLDQNVELIVQTAELRRAREEAKLATRDETLSIEERLEAQDKAIELDKELLNLELEAAREAARISQEKTDLGKSSRKELEENAQLQAEVINLESAYFTRSKELYSERISLSNQLRSAEKAQSDQQIAIAKEREEKLKQQEKEEAELLKKQSDAARKTAEDAQKFVENELEIWELRNQRAIESGQQLTDSLIDEENARLDTLAELRIVALDQSLTNELITRQEYELRLLKIQDETNKEKLTIQTAYEKQRTTIEKEAAKLREILAEEESMAKLEFAQIFLGAIADIAGEGTVAQQAASSSLIAIDTVRGAMAAFASMQSLPPPLGMIAGVAAAAAVSARGAKAIRDVWAVNKKGTTSVPSSGGGRGLLFNPQGHSVQQANRDGGFASREVEGNSIGASAQAIADAMAQVPPKNVLVTDQVTADQTNTEDLSTLATI